MSENKCGLSNIPDYIVYESINEVYRAIKKKSGMSSMGHRSICSLLSTCTSHDN